MADQKTKKEISDASIAACQVALMALAEEFYSGTITIDELEGSFKEELKREYIRQYLYGIGGEQNMTKSDWEVVAKDLQNQYKYAEEFIAQLDIASQQDDEGESLKAMFWRFSLYALGAIAVYELANGLFHLADGYTEELWVVDPSVENCPDCLSYESMGWLEIGSFPEPGDWSTVCGSHCHCHKEYRK